jgi:hypothetical protein
MGCPSSSTRRSDDRTVKKVFLGKPDGRRKAGRPKVRRQDCGENDLKPTSVKRWRKKGGDASAWAIILKEKLANYKYRMQEDRYKKKGNEEEEERK